MKEFIEKLIGRLEEKRKSYFKTFFEYGLNTDLGREDGLKESIKIVNELAEEYNNDFCEWRKDKIMSGMYVACSGYVTYLKDFKFCPYCGKEIKVVE